mgnify:FL=1
MGLVVILVGVGSGNVKTRQTKKDKQETTQIVSGVQIVTEDGKKYYDFQDVKENNYRARLLDQVPRNSYDFSNLALDEETGYLSYKDTKGKVSAKKGIDVSEFQGETIDWQQVKESGIEFVIVRLGYRAYGESGALVEDAMFEQNVQGALDAGLEVGVYFFSQQSQQRRQSKRLTLFWNISSRIRLQDLLSMTQKKSKMIQQEQIRIQGKTLRIFVKSFVTE